VKTTSSKQWDSQSSTNTKLTALCQQVVMGVVVGPQSLDKTYFSLWQSIRVKEMWDKPVQKVQVNSMIRVKMSHKLGTHVIEMHVEIPGLVPDAVLMGETDNVDTTLAPRLYRFVNDGQAVRFGQIVKDLNEELVLGPV